MAFAFLSPHEEVRYVLERKDFIMKTNQIMIRPMGDFTVSQRTKDGYFDGGDLLRQWNSVKGNEQRKMDEFLLAKRTRDFIEALIVEERENGLGENSPKIDNQVVKKSKVKEKGKAGRPKEEVWMHPFLFTKFAMLKSFTECSQYRAECYRLKAENEKLKIELSNSLKVSRSSRNQVEHFDYASRMGAN